MGGRNLLARMKRWCHVDYVNYLYFCTPESLLASAPAVYPGVRPIVCDLANLEEVKAGIRDFPSPIERGVRKGNLAILGVVDQQWIFRSLAVLGPKVHLYDGYPMALTTADCFLEYAETQAAWRGKGVAPGMLGPTAEALRARGITQIYLAIDATNTASCRAAEKGGARRVGEFTCHRRWGRWSSTYLGAPEERNATNRGPR